MAIGMRPKRKGLFGSMPDPMSNGPYGTPPIMAPRQKMDDMQPGMGMMQQQQQPEPARQPYNPAGNKLYALGGIIANLGGVRNNAAGEYFATQQQQAQAASQAQAAQAERMAGLQDWRWKEDYKRDNPAAQTDTAFERDYSFILETEGPEAASQFMRNKYTAPPTVIDNGDGTKTIYPAGALPRGGQPAQQGPLPTFSNDDWDNAGDDATNSVGGFPDGR